jgi:hypothetical protein
MTQIPSASRSSLGLLLCLRLLNVLMIGGLTLAIGATSQALADAGVTLSRTWPLLGADVIAFSGLWMVWRATRYPTAVV